MDASTEPVVGREPGSELPETLELPCAPKYRPLLLEERRHLLLVSEELLLHLREPFVVIPVCLRIAPICDRPHSTFELLCLHSEGPPALHHLRLES